MINLNLDNKEFFSDDYDIIILAGQSNCVGYAKGVKYYPESDNVKQLYFNPVGYKRKMPWNKNKFYFHNARPRELYLTHFTGFYLYFAHHYERTMLQKGRKLLFLRSAVGGTGFADKRWGLNDDLYQDSIKTAKLLLEGNKNNRIVGILWHQGEADVTCNSTEEYYYEKLTNLLHGYRKELNIPNLPFIAGDFVEEWRIYQPNYLPIKTATLRVINENENCAFVNTDGLKGNKKPDNIHFNDESNIIIGKKYFDKFREIVENDIK